MGDAMTGKDKATLTLVALLLNLDKTVKGIAPKPSVNHLVEQLEKALSELAEDDEQRNSPY
jgi:trehalose-6-phosphatase